MPPIGLNAAVHNNLSPFMGDARREGGRKGSQERQMRDRREKQGREGRNDGE